MFKIKQVLCIIFLLCIGAVQAQDLSVVNCSTVLIIPEDSVSVGDTLVDIIVDNPMDDGDEFGIMFIVEVEDSSLVNQIHINIGTTPGDSTVLSQSYSVNSNMESDNLVYQTYSNFVNVKVGEHTIDSVLHYFLKLEDINGNQSLPFTGIIEK